MILGAPIWEWSSNLTAVDYLYTDKKKNILLKLENKNNIANSTLRQCDKEHVTKMDSLPYVEAPITSGAP